MLSDFEVRGVKGYLLAAIAVALAIIIREMLEPLIGGGFEYFLVFPAVVAAAMVAGRGPAVFAGILGAIAAEYFLASPEHMLVLDAITFARMAFVSATGVYAGHVGAELRKARRREQARSREFEFLNRLVEFSKNPFYVIDPEDFRLVYANRATAEHLGRSMEETLGLHMWDWEPCGRAECEKLRERLQRDKGVAYETVHRCRDGREIPVEVSANYFEFRGRKYIGGYFRDMQAKRQAEEERRQGEALYRAIARNIPGGAVVVIDAEMHVRIVEGPLVSRLGYNRGMIEGLTIWEAADAELLGLAESRVRKALVGRAASYKSEYKGFTLWSQYVPLRDAEGRVNAAMVLALDITERERAEEELRRSEFFHRQTLESIPGMVFTTRADGYCDYQSQQWVEYTGVPMKEHMGDGWNKLLHPEDRPKAMAAWRAAVEGRASYDLEYRVRRHDGEYEWFKAIGRPIRDESGQIVRWFGVTMNIESLKRAEEALRESEERYASLFRNNHAVMLLIDPATGRIEDANPAACEYYGYCYNELTRKNIDEINTLGREEVRREIDKARTRSARQFRFTHRLASGALREVSVASGPISVRGREMLYSLIFDVTAQVEAERALRESEERFRTLADNMSQLAWMADESGRIFWYNKRWLEYTGTSQEQMLGEGWQKVQHADHLSRVAEGFSRCLKSGEVWEDTFPMRGADGEYRWFLTRAVPIKDNSGKVTRWFGTNTDVTDQLNNQEQLERLMYQLESKNREMEAIISIVSHDLRSPLITIGGFNKEIRKGCKLGRDALERAGVGEREVEVLERLLDDEIPESTEYIESAAKSMDELVGALVQVARAGFSPVRPERVDMEELVNNARAAFAFKMQEAGAVMEVGPLPGCYADRVQMGQVFANLLDNAIKYRDESRRCSIRVSGRIDGERAVYVVEDNGLGIAMQDQGKIFDMFQRLENKKIVGEGIGLATVKRYVERNNGTISLESRPGEGSRFMVTLPAG